MSLKFCYEDGHGEILDESGTEAMDWEGGGDPFNTETLMTLTQYQRTRIMCDLDPADPQLNTVTEDVEKMLLQRGRSLLESTMFIQTIRNLYFFIVFE